MIRMIVSMNFWKRCKNESQRLKLSVANAHASGATATAEITNTRYNENHCYPSENYVT